MQNDRAFVVYSLGLIALTALVATWAMMVTGLGLAAHPAALVIEHLALGITFRAAYKCLDGSNYILDLLYSTGMLTREEEAQQEAQSGAAPLAHAA